MTFQRNVLKEEFVINENKKENFSKISLLQDMLIDIKVSTRCESYTKKFSQPKYIPLNGTHYFINNDGSRNVYMGWHGVLAGWIRCKNNNYLFLVM